MKFLYTRMLGFKFRIITLRLNNSVTIGPIKGNIKRSLKAIAWSAGTQNGYNERSINFVLSLSLGVARNARSGTVTDVHGHDGDQVVHAPDVRVDWEALLLRRNGQGPTHQHLHAAGPVRRRSTTLARCHGRQGTRKKNLHLIYSLLDILLTNLKETNDS